MTLITNKQHKALWHSLHWLLMLVVTINVFTGLRIATVNHEWLLWLSPILPQGQVHLWHGFAATLLLGIVLVYLIATVFGLRPRPTANAYFRWLKLVGLTMTLLIVISGLLLYFGLVYGGLHFYIALAVISYIGLHTLGYFLRFGRKALRFIFFKPRWRWLATLSFTVSLISAVLIFTSMQTQTLLHVQSIKLDDFIELDGFANEAAWQNAEEISVLTSGGDNFMNGESRVVIKALHNGVDGYFYIRWLDATQSLNHLPLRKTASGWQVEENGFYVFDETQYYEDKFAIMLSNSCEFAAAHSTHLGNQPIADKPANWHQKGYHYRTDGQISDIWQWKAVRTNAMQQMDDNYFGAPAPALAGNRRYTAGYQSDSKESGGYVMNWLGYTPNGITPKRLPIDAAEATSPWLTWFGSQVYQSNNDDYALGAQLPSVLYRSNQFEGDRGDVRAVGRWHDGEWHLEISRQLDTQSKQDLALQSGVCLWVSAFDHTQIGHTRHARAIQLEF